MGFTRSQVQLPQIPNLVPLPKIFQNACSFQRLRYSYWLVRHLEGQEACSHAGRVVILSLVARTRVGRVGFLGS